MCHVMKPVPLIAADCRHTFYSYITLIFFCVSFYLLYYSYVPYKKYGFLFFLVPVSCFLIASLLRLFCSLLHLSSHRSRSPTLSLVQFSILRHHEPDEGLCGHQFPAADQGAGAGSGRRRDQHCLQDSGEDGKTSSRHPSLSK